MKQIRRQYSPRGSRRDTVSIRIDRDVKERLKIVAGKLKITIAEAVERSLLKIEQDQAKELE
jgi:antitoxin component of RelBE/YafQ-DinJ toxin-antitoxin module